MALGEGENIEPQAQTENVVDGFTPPTGAVEGEKVTDVEEGEQNTGIAHPLYIYAFGIGVAFLNMPVVAVNRRCVIMLALRYSLRRRHHRTKNKVSASRV